MRTSLIAILSMTGLSHAWICQYRFTATHKNNERLMQGCTTAANVEFNLEGKKSVLFKIGNKHPGTCIDTSCINGGFDELVKYCKNECSAAGSEFVTVGECVPNKKCGPYK